eukprot:364280-Chlamydomonas_euryale.AAC.18
MCLSYLEAAVAPQLPFPLPQDGRRRNDERRTVALAGCRRRRRAGHARPSRRGVVRPRQQQRDALDRLAQALRSLRVWACAYVCAEQGSLPRVRHCLPEDMGFASLVLAPPVAFEKHSRSGSPQGRLFGKASRRPEAATPLEGRSLGLSSTMPSHHDRVVAVRVEGGRWRALVTSDQGPEGAGATVASIGT